MKSFGFGAAPPPQKPSNDNELILDPALKDTITVRKPLSFRKPTKKELKEVFNPAAAAPKIKTAKYDKDGNTPLLRAIDAEDVKAVKRLLGTGNDPNQPAEDGTTPLQAALQTRSLPVVQALLDGGATVDAATISSTANYTIGRYKGTPEAERPDFALIDAFVKQGGSGADLSPLLHDAANAGDVPLLKKLVSAGGDINHAREWARAYSLERGSFTPAMCAIGSENRSFALVHAVLALGADAKQAFNYHANRRQFGDEPVMTEPLGVLLHTAAETGNLPDFDTCKAEAHENKIEDMIANPPPGLKYRRGLKITRAVVENYLKHRR